MMSLEALLLQFVWPSSSISEKGNYFLLLNIGYSDATILPEHVGGHQSNPVRRRYNREE